MKPSRFVTFMALTATAVFAGAVPARAATFNVDRFDDSATALDCNPAVANDCSLRGAIIKANGLPGGNTIVLPAGTYTLTIPGQNEDNAAIGDLDIRSDLTIIGADAATTIIDGGGLDRVFHILSFPSVDIAVTISDVTIQNGDCRSSNCLGGGVLNQRNGALSILRLEGAIVRANASGVPGFQLGGGGIFNSHGSLIVVDSTITGNTTLGSGGGINCFGADAGLRVENSIVSGNTADSVGGGISANCGLLTTIESLITNNTAVAGGGILVGAMVLTDSTVSNNTAQGRGGGLVVFGQADVAGSTISGNAAGIGSGQPNPDGGGILLEGSDSVLNLANSTVSGNATTRNGGGIALAGGDLPHTVNLNNVTITNNTADSDRDLNGSGGGIFGRFANEVFNVRNTIIAGNIDPSAAAPDCAATIVSLGHNLIQDPAGCVVSGDTTSIVVGLDPRLDPLAANGGPTLTHGLLAGSPAIDAGDNATCEATDQRGVDRPVGPACDIGAFEGALARLTILTESPLLNQLGEFSSDSLEATGGVGPYSWSVIDGALPAGMQLSAQGILSGTPTQMGSFAFSVRVTDSTNATAEKTFVKEVSLTPAPQIRLDKFGTAAVPGREITYFILVRNVGKTVARDVEIVEFLDPWSHISFVDPPPVDVTLADLFFGDPGQALPVERSVFWNIPMLSPGGMTIIQYKTILNDHFPVGLEVRGGPVCVAGGTTCDLDFISQMESALGQCSAACSAIGDVQTLLAIPNLAKFFTLTSEAERQAFLSGLGGSAVDKAAGMIITSAPGCEDCLKFNEFFAQLNRSTCGEVLKATEDCNFFIGRALLPLDPNEKGVIAPRFIQPDQTLVYPIHFENIGDIEALNVFVTDVLDPNLDVSTVKILTPSGTFDAATRTVRWALLGINLAPDKSDNVLLAVKPLPGLPSGTEIRNRAAIQFEVFEPMTTNEVVNIIDSMPPTCVMAALPPLTASASFPISWSGTDAIGEIRSYTILVSVNGAGFTPFLTDTTETSTTFDGQAGKTYGFICVATDTARNAEVQALIAEAVTVVAQDRMLTSLSPVRAWVGLKNSDDVGTRFDLKAEAYEGAMLIGSGQLNGVPGGSSGFNNAKLDSIPLAISAPVGASAGSSLRIKLSARITCSGETHRSGTARLWFNDAQANSRFGATIGGISTDYFLLGGSALGSTMGSGPKSIADVFLNSEVACPTRPFMPFGTWSITLP